MIMDEINKYAEGLFRAQVEYEALCKRCGACCIAEADPCANLIKQLDGTYLCRDYHNRLGKQKTINGGEFTCVEIRDHVSLGYTIPGCPYFS